ncbi:MAG TPA: phage holin family protein [Streptosporangiaceae bacterium]
MAERESSPAARQADASTADLVRQLAEQTSHLVRDELRLAQAEMTRKGARAGRGAGLLGGSGILALYGTGCLLIAAVAGLALVLATWLAALIVAAAVLAVAGLAALTGKQQLGRATPPVPRQAIESTKADVQEIREKAHR